MMKDLSLLSLPILLACMLAANSFAQDAAQTKTPEKAASAENASKTDRVENRVIN